MQLKGKDYMMVHQRLIWFREDHPMWGIETDVVEGDKVADGFCIIKDETGRTIATGHKKETAAGFPDYTEKAETGAVGRALLFCGYGTAFAASELDEGERIVDSPVQPLAKQAAPTKTIPIPSNGTGKAFDTEYKTDQKIPDAFLKYYPDFYGLSWKQASTQFPERACKFYESLIKYEKEKGKPNFKAFNIEKYTYLLEVAQENFVPGQENRITF